jgi:hypothetical protein
MPSRRQLDDIPKMHLEFGEKRKAFGLTLAEKRPGVDEHNLRTSAADQ